MSAAIEVFFKQDLKEIISLHDKYYIEALITGNPSALTEEERAVWDEATKYMTKTVTIEGTNETYSADYRFRCIKAIAATYAKGSAQVQENNYNELIKENSFLNNLATQEIISESIFGGVDAGVFS